MRDYTEEEIKIISSTEITMDCFEMDDYSNVLIDDEDGVAIFGKF